MIIRKVKIDELDEICLFIEKMNSEEKNQIGYCGDEFGDIKDYLTNDFGDTRFEESFIIAKNKNEIVGLIGFDSDIEDKSVEIWGPFIKYGNEEIFEELWENTLEILSQKIKKANFFINIENTIALNFAEMVGCKKISEEYVMEICRTDISNENDKNVNYLDKKDNESFVKLHNSIFPKTYYSGETIISRVNETRKVFSYTKEDKLLGYIYCEIQNDFGSANIEFFAVDENYRKKGIGSSLMNKALNWIFSFKSIDTISLCVNAKKTGAIKLYRKAGFRYKHHLVYLLKEFDTR